MKRFFFLPILLLSAFAAAMAANRTVTVEQVTTAVTLSEGVDYHITSETPFATTGSINLADTENAVLILDNVRPSQVAAWLEFITVDGSKAVKGTNCQVRIYNRGTIIYPYGESVKMLTAYTEPDFGGDSYNNYRIGNQNGYMLTLSATQLNNRIRSFKLKRGYMVTFAIGAGGYGYSRCFIADKEDLEVKSLPAILDRRISSYRIFKWQDISKRGYAGTDATANRLLRTTWFYGWNADGGNSYDDYEYVPQHHHEGWPSIESVGANGNSAHALGNNEPDNKADDKEQDLDPVNVLANWEKMMATGKRLGSPAVSGNKSWLKEFIDSIDKRGWRVDFIAVHDYNLNDRSSKLWNVSDYKAIGNGRPVWLTEMNYGANWTSWPGSNTDGNAANYQIELSHFGPTIDGYNETDYVERYAFYNWVQDCRKAYNTDDQTLAAKNYLTPMGEYYAAVDPGLAYNSKYDYVPRLPRVKAPQELSLKYVAMNSQCTLNWTEPNPELLDSVFIEVKTDKGRWERLTTIAIDETKTAYEYKFTNAVPGNYSYRIHTVAYDKIDRYSSEIYNVISGSEVITDDIQVGTVSASASAANYSYFAQTLDEEPVAVFGSVSNYNANSALVERVRNINYSSRQYRSLTANVQPLTYGTQTDFYRGSNYPEYSSFIVARKGNGTLGTLRYEAALLPTMQVGDTADYSFAEPFGSVPVVMATPYYSSDSYPLLWRVFDVTAEGCRVVLERQAGLEADNPARNPARIMLFAVEKGRSQLDNGRVVIVADSVYTFTTGSTLSQELPYGEEIGEPKVLAQLQTRNRNSAGFLRTKTKEPGQSETTLRLQLDYSNKTNNTISRNNPAVERVGWIVVGTTTNIDDGIATAATWHGQLQIFPTAAGQTFGLRDDTATSAVLYAVSGQQLKAVALTGGQATVDIASLPAGIYIVRTDTRHSAKIMKK